MKDIKTFLSIILIIISFFIWYLFSERKCELEKVDNWKKQVNIEIMKTKLKVTKNSEDIEIFVNWENYLTWSIEMQKE